MLNKVIYEYTHQTEGGLRDLEGYLTTINSFSSVLEEYE